MPSSSHPGTGGHSSSSTSATPARAPGTNACPGWTMRKPSGMPNQPARPVPGPFLAPGRAYCRTAARKSHTPGQALQTSFWPFSSNATGFEESMTTLSLSKRACCGIGSLIVSSQRMKTMASAPRTRFRASALPMWPTPTIAVAASLRVADSASRWHADRSAARHKASPAGRARAQACPPGERPVGAPTCRQAVHPRAAGTISAEAPRVVCTATMRAATASSKLR